MNEQALWLDGNALGGLLQELFATELTDAPHGFESCGAVRAIGAHRLYRGAGLVLRWPVCSDIALVVATAPNTRVGHLAGTWRMEISGAG
jgi:Family of unknown function (DUF6510)